MIGKLIYAYRAGKAAARRGDPRPENGGSNPTSPAAQFYQGWQDERAQMRAEKRLAQLELGIGADGARV